MVKASTNTHDRLSMIIGLIKDEKFGYPQLHEGFTYYGDYVEFNIFNSYRHAPTIVIAVSIDEGTNHAVTLFDNYIFDSNEDHAIPISIEGLNRCFPPAFKRTQEVFQFASTIHWKSDESSKKRKRERMKSKQGEEKQID